ncbi:hypothetical protein QOZ80_6BG0481850 [Eleusine coracana subsp. coracana]|nr:hypothetical protein QOZ80_6BG0481850 [Eleusine coracana subsp. coracana]
MAPAILFFLLLAAAAAPRHAAAGTEYAVGDAAGWTNGPNYLAWSQNYNFTAGDTLVFNYVQGRHDVYQVTEDAFRTCEPARKTLRVWVSGRDLVNLTEPGDYYYICNVEGHCLGGMKLAVSVAAAPPPPPPPPSPPMFLDPPPPPPTGSAGVSWITRRLAWPQVVRIPCLAVIGMLLVA